MCADWKSGYNPDVITTGLEKIKSTSENGEVSFTGFEFNDYVTVLLSSLKFVFPFPDLYKRQFVHKGIAIVAKSKTLTKSALLQEISKLEQAYMREPIKEYLLVSDISLHIPTARESVGLNDTRIIFSCHLSSKIQRDVFLKLGREFLNRELPTAYSYIQIMTRGRSPEEAGIVALDTIDLLRGIWNFALNRKRHVVLHAKKRDPINKILLGPLHSLHYPNGKRLPDPFWYDPTYVEPVSPMDLRRNWDSLRSFERQVRKRLSKSHSRTFMEEAFRRYAVALDERNHETAFLKLWSLLEYLTRTTIKDSHKVTVTRAVSVWSDRDFHQEVLHHLRDYRNSAVHMDQRNEEITKLLYQLKRYVEALLEFHVFHGHKFANLGNITSFFDLPTDKATLTEQKHLIQKRLRFIRT
ncbi:MAG: hypothetical protein P0120_17040 [Nitrospira sp.]|nr:hypothetical protein [Nitrospira sp.]